MFNFSFQSLLILRNDLILPFECYLFVSLGLMIALIKISMEQKPWVTTLPMVQLALDAASVWVLQPPPETNVSDLLSIITPSAASSLPHVVPSGFLFSRSLPLSLVSFVSLKTRFGVLNISCCFHTDLFTSSRSILHPRAPQRTPSSVSSSRGTKAPPSFTPLLLFLMWCYPLLLLLHSPAKPVPCSFKDTCFLFGEECFSWLLTLHQELFEYLNNQRAF